MFVDDGTDDTTTTDTTDTTDDTTATDTTDTDTGTDDLTVEIDGETYQAEENFDFDQDGQNDAAVVQTDDGYLAMYDTDDDGVADTAVTLDEQGNVTGAAEFDESTGEWVAADPASVENPSGDGADGSTDTTTDDSTDTGTDTQTTDTSGDSMVVEGPEGESLDVGPAEHDTDGDGQADSSVVTDADGTTYIFTDTDLDGDADQAVVVETDGDVTVVAEPADDGNWEVVETGHIDEQGNYTPDSASSTDSAWAGN